MTALVAVVVALVAVPSPILGQGIVIWDGITSTTPSLPTINSVWLAMEAGKAPSGGAWTAVANGSSVEISQIFSSSTGGNLMNYGVAITSLKPVLTLGSVQVSMTDKFSSLSGTFASLNLPYDQLLGIGINYGPDGIPGTADDIVYTSGNLNSPVNAIYLFGMAKTINIGSQSPASAEAAWASLCPFTQTVTYSENGMSGTTCITYAAPEPSVFALLFMSGMGYLVFLRRRK